MKKIILSLFIGLSLNSFAQEAPKVLKKSFTKDALSQTVKTADGKTITIAKILQKHSGKIVLIDLWAGWCRDCLNALPKAKELEEKNPDVDFVFLSLDRSEEGWKKGREKFGIEDKENYWFSEGWKNKFNNYIDLNWIPRYMVINQKGAIAKYYAVSPYDADIQNVINNLANDK